MKTLRLFLLVPLSILSATASAAPASRPNEDNLTQAFAKARKQQVRSVDYDLSFRLDSGSTQFSGSAVLTTELADPKKPLSIDLQWKELKAVRVNGKPVTDLVKRKGSFDIPAKHLSATNRIEVDYVGEFNKDGEGFQRVVDPEDQSEYLYTDFEPYNAHGLFPSFDQPDLKSKYRLSVNAPAIWKIIGNEKIETTERQGDRISVKFAQTKPISTYLFFLGAGPFEEWKDKAGEIPLTIYARKTLAKHVDAENLFHTTKKGFEFFQSYFGSPYPFTKYDQIFIPEFAWGGMENVGAVTLNERNIFRGPVTTARREGRDSLILHEMAHMWFGDLVTMEWWNDLWLNESFATYLASIAQTRALSAKGTWLSFFSTKTWGYWQDQLVTTHPIETEVSDVRTARGNFDGITYAKGASALKQLHFFVGEDGFREGLRSYFKKFAFQNTRRSDFIGEIAAASKKPLDDWTKVWLQTAGPNRVTARWSCSDGKLKDFSLIQSPNVSKALSPHRTRVGLFSLEKGDQGSMKLLRSQDVAYSGKETPVAELKGTACPDFVYPNMEDHDYGLFALDQKSLANARTALVKASDPLLRLMIWNTLNQMVRDAEFSPNAFMETALVALPEEKDEDVLSIVLGRNSLIRSTYAQYLTLADRTALAPRLEKLVWDRAAKSENKSNLQLTFFDFYIGIAQSPEALQRLGEILEKGKAFDSLELDQDRRWAIVTALASMGVPKASALIAAEEKRDPSTAGKRFAFGARAAIPTLENKKKVWKELVDSKEIPQSVLKTGAGAFHHPNHPELTREFIKPYFELVKSIDWKSNDPKVDLFLERLFPGTVCSDDVLKQSSSQLKSALNLTSLARRAWLEANDELSRCVKVVKHTKSGKALGGLH